MAFIIGLVDRGRCNWGVIRYGLLFIGSSDCSVLQPVAFIGLLGSFLECLAHPDEFSQASMPASDLCRKQGPLRLFMSQCSSWALHSNTTCSLAGALRRMGK